MQAQECAAPTVLKDRNQLKGARGSSETQVVRTEKKSTPRPTLRNRGWGTLRAFVSCVDRKKRVVIVSGAEKRRRILSAPPAGNRFDPDGIPATSVNAVRIDAMCNVFSTGWLAETMGSVIRVD